jgi:hypothetical protein
MSEEEKDYLVYITSRNIHLGFLGGVLVRIGAVFDGL